MIIPPIILIVFLTFGIAIIVGNGEPFWEDWNKELHNYKPKQEK